MPKPNISEGGGNDAYQIKERPPAPPPIRKTVQPDPAPVSEEDLQRLRAIEKLAGQLLVCDDDGNTTIIGHEKFKSALRRACLWNGTLPEGYEHEAEIEQLRARIKELEAGIEDLYVERNEAVDRHICSREALYRVVRALVNDNQPELEAVDDTRVIELEKMLKTQQSYTSNSKRN